MPRFVAFLRAINVGGHRVTMDHLRSLFESLGFSSVETFIASGNVIFETHVTDTAVLERKIENHLRESLGYEVATFLRTEAEIEVIAKHKAFTESELQAAVAYSVGFLAEPLSKDGRRALMSLTTEIDHFNTDAREVYWLCRTRQSESTFAGGLLEKTLKTRTTFRGMNTVSRLAAKYPSSTVVGRNRDIGENPAVGRRSGRRKPR